jgi:hypothetical protein
MTTIEKVKDIPLTSLKLKVGVYGDSGTGKTFLASSFPKVCFIDCNNGLLSVRHTSASCIKCPPLDSYQWMESIQNAVNLISTKDEIESIAIDSMSEVGMAAMNYVQYKNNTAGKNPNFEDWRIFFNVLQDFIVGVLSMNKHCIFIAHEVIERDELIGKVFCRPAIQGQMKNKFASYFDEFYHSEVEQIPGKSYKYRLLARPNSIYTAKSRLLRNPETSYIDDPSFATLFKMIS